jgi:EAL domain-containing protein (putative c-di-GMP-specific phosphodiesterase class I)
MPKKHILLVDDEVDFAETMALRLQMRGYEVSVAHNGEEALKKAKEKPDLILLDVMMPSINGYAVCHRLRQDNETRHIPIIMLTAKQMPQDKVEGLQIGADDYITKSFDAEELFARIEALLRRSGLSEQVQEDKAILIKELKRIIQNKLVEITFQPIFYLRPRRLFAYEVLTRGPQDSLLEKPEKLFQCALSCGMLFDLEMICRKKVLAILGDIVTRKLIFFNSNPYLIESERFSEILSLYNKPEQIVLEITERTEIKDFSAFCQTLNLFRAMGFRISIDDVGSGYSNLGAIAELEPDFVKIDLGLIRGIDTNPKKQNLVKAIMLFCKQSKIISIGEGIETESELDTLINLGLDAGQGYLLGRPRIEVLGE